MLYIGGCLLFVIASTALLIKKNIPHPLSKGIAVAAGLSLLALISLAHNAVLSFIPEANDGISISNRIAYWIIGEGEWSTNAFQSAFVTALYLTCGLILAYPITLAIEANKKNRQRNWR